MAFRRLRTGDGSAPCAGNILTRKPVTDATVCASYGHAYPIVAGVPVVKPQAATAADEDWNRRSGIAYQAFYSSRSRQQDLRSDYLVAERLLMARLVKGLEIQGPSLEVGCGTGLFADVVPDFGGLDYTLELRLATRLEGYRRVCGDAHCVPLPSESVGRVFSFNTLEHSPGVDLAFAEMDRALAPGGLLVLKPAWHAARFTTELIHVRSHGELSFRRQAHQSAAAPDRV